MADLGLLAVLCVLAIGQSSGALGVDPLCGLDNCIVCADETSCQTCDEGFFVSSGECSGCSDGCTECIDGDSCINCALSFEPDGSSGCTFCEGYVEGCSSCSGFEKIGDNLIPNGDFEADPPDSNWVLSFQEIVPGEGGIGNVLRIRQFVEIPVLQQNTVSAPAPGETRIFSFSCKSEGAPANMIAFVFDFDLSSVLSYVCPAGTFKTFNFLLPSENFSESIFAVFYDYRIPDLTLEQIPPVIFDNFSLFVAGPVLPCEECLGNFVLTDQNQCECPTQDGFILTAEGECIQCGQNCASCTESECLSCQEGFFVNTGGECDACGENCVSCNELECLTCEDGFIEKRGSCLSEDFFLEALCSVLIEDNCDGFGDKDDRDDRDDKDDKDDRRKRNRKLSKKSKRNKRNKRDEKCIEVLDYCDYYFDDGLCYQYSEYSLERAECTSN